MGVDFCRDEQRSQSRQSDKWIPPSAFKRDALPENCDDVKFRKVSAILKKIKIKFQVDHMKFLNRSEEFSTNLLPRLSTD